MEESGNNGNWPPGSGWEAIHGEVLAACSWDGSVQQLVAARASEAPDAVAVLELDGREVTYRQLVEASTAAAERLHEEGVTREGGVALCVDEGAEHVVLELAVLKAGGWFLPMDLQYPVARLRMMLQDAQPQALLVAQQHLKGLRAALMGDEAATGGSGGEWRLESVRMLAAEAVLEGGSRAGEMRLPEVAPSCAAYVQYTSGSTGAPKGVVAEHGQLASYARAKALQERIGRGSRVMLASAFTFDPCQGDTFCALTAGATLCLASRLRVLHDLAGALRQTGASHVCSTPALWGLMPSPPPPLPRLRCVSLGGESMPHSMAAEWAPAVELRNVYGVTEATVYQSSHLLLLDDVSLTPERAGLPVRSAGRPLPNSRLLVLRPDTLAPAAVGEEGEIFIGGLGVARGYLRRPQLTAQRFLQHPRWGRIYRTGDAGRWLLQQGLPHLQLLGRLDDQVKLNGERVELGEVEAVLRSCPLVAAAAVTVVNARLLCAHLVLHPDLDDSPPPAMVEEAGQNGAATAAATSAAGPRGAGLPVLEQGEAVEGAVESALEAFCSCQLPRNMVPRRIARWHALPLSPNGKVDRRRLLPPEVRQVAAQCRSALEQTVADIWTQELRLVERGRERASPLDSFFHLGGDSVAAVRVVRRIRAIVKGGGGGEGWEEDAPDSRWRDPSGDAGLFLPEVLAGDAECAFGICAGPYAPCNLLLRPVLREYCEFLAGQGVRRREEEPGLPRLQQHTAGDALSPGWPAGAGGETPPEEGTESTAAQAAEEQRSSAAFQASTGQPHELPGVSVAHPQPPLETAAARRMAALLDAAAGGQLRMVLTLLRAGLPADGMLHASPRAKGLAPLHVAAAGNHVEVVKALLVAGARPAAVTEVGATPAHMAAAGGGAEALQLLLQAGVQAAVRDSGKRTILHYAARRGSEASVTLALQHGAGRDAMDHRMRTALHWAVVHGHTHVVRQLLDAGASVNFPRGKVPWRQFRRRTRVALEAPLDTALRLHRANGELLQMLRAAGARSVQGGHSCEAVA